MLFIIVALTVVEPTVWAEAAAVAASGRPRGPCDIYASADTPCVAAHSTVRALYAAYNGPLYSVKRAADQATMVVRVDPSTGFADASAESLLSNKLYIAPLGL
jgi:hypothetical protein